MITQDAAASVSAQAGLDRLLESIAGRIQAGESFDAEACLVAHPEYREQLASLLPAMQLLLAFGQSRSAPGGGEALAAPAGGDGVLGDFRIVREIGRGGMGVVYEAEQVSLARRVALKLLPFAAILDPRQLARFKNEARAAAQLHHTNIVPVFSVGCERGVHYYAMQYIEGRSLAQCVAELSAARDARRAGGKSPAESGGREDGGSASAAARSAADTEALAALSTLPDYDTREYCRTVARLGIQAAEGLAHAHQHGVLHRDIKPANLMLDATGTLWITDFGLARLEADAGMTMTGDLIGTLRYMSPEQAGVAPGEVDPRSDIYSLGVTLYELLALRPAIGGAARRDALRQIAEVEPERLARANRSVPRELETIVLKAAAKQADDRYKTAQALADDLRRFLDDKPIAARRASLAHKCGKWIRRHRALAAVATASLAFSLAVLAGAWRWSAALDRARQLEVARQEQAEARTAKRQLQQFNYAVDLRLIDDLKLLRDAEMVRPALEKYRPAPGEADLRGFEWHFFRQSLERLERSRRGSTAAHARQIYCLALSHDGKLLATAAEDLVAKVWRYPSMELASTLAGHVNDVNYAAFSPDDRTLATCSDDGTVRLWDVASGAEKLRVAAHPTWADGGGDKHAVRVEFSPDGQTLASMSRTLTRLWDVATGAPRGDLPGAGLAFARAHRMFATAPDETAIVLWDVDTLKEAARLPVNVAQQAPILAAQFNATDTLLVSGDGRGYLSVWRQEWEGTTRRGKWVRRVWAGDAPISSVSLSADGKQIATASFSGQVSVWYVGGLPFRRVAGPYFHSDRAWAARFSPDGKTLLSSGMDGKVASWDAASEQLAQPVYWTGSTGPLTGKYTADGKNFWLLRPRETGRKEGGEQLFFLKAPVDTTWSLAASRRARTQASQEHDTQAQYYVDAMARSPSGRQAAVAGAGGVFVWDESDDSSAPLRRILAWGDAGPTAATPVQKTRGSAVYLDEQTLAVIHAGAVQVVDVDRGAIIEVLKSPDERQQLGRLAISPDRKQLAVGGELGSFWLYDLSQRQWTSGGRAAAAAVLCMEFIWPQQWLALGTQDATIAVWDLRTARMRHQLDGHRGPVAALAWSAANRRLASAGLGDGGVVRLWDVELGQQVSTFHTDPDCQLHDAEFSPDGKALAACGVVPPYEAFVFRWRIGEE